MIELKKELFKGRDFITLNAFTAEEIAHMIDVAIALKQDRKNGIPHPVLQGKVLAMIFTKSSTRTRVAFEAGIYQLGGSGMFLSGRDIQLGRGEPIADTARVLSRMVDGIMIRTFSHQEVLDLAQSASIPVINGLSDFLHPTQILADMVTIKEHKGQVEGMKLTYIGDSNNVANSLILGGTKMGMHIVIASPQGYQPVPEILDMAWKNAAVSKGSVMVVEDPVAAAKNADVLYTDVWASMGQEEESEIRKNVFAPYQINDEVLQAAHPEAIVMHCLPAHRGEEITDKVIEGPQSVVFDEAENRLHAHKAIMALVM
ncbi:ornithine carbamoyltransferase [Dehalobacter sp. DCM]|uniref:ornithine carbamoyltransferase n=1 Tax=Dehalobacter sp. DCM TaxID=2907827 RepID=UPI0030813C2B|nr:ornithine carbamoyltransferase [Dehalobacter sp. DCM]